MTTRHARRTQRLRRRRIVGTLTSVALGLAVAMVPSIPARAADGPFDITGAVVPDDVNADVLQDAFGSIKELGPKNGSSTKIGVIHKAALPMLDSTNPNAQVDLRRAWLATAEDPGDHHLWLYFAWERDANSGSGFIGFEFMQNPPPTSPSGGCAYGTATEAQLIANCNPWKNRDAGDFMILWDQSGSSTTLYKRVWSGTAPNLTLSAPVALSGTDAQAAFSPDKFKGEAALDLTDAVFGGSTTCKSFVNVIPSTVTGNSDTADYKDTILSKVRPVTNCGSTTTTTPKQGDGSAIPAGGLSIGTGVVAVQDEAVVTVQGADDTPTGDVSFWLCKVDAPAVCADGEGTSIGSGTLSGDPATTTSPTAYVTAAGRYCWRSEYAGDEDAGIPGSKESSASECFTVNPVTPTLSTTAGGNVEVGQSVTDSATLTGTAYQPADPVINTSGDHGAPAGGTITFKLLGPDNCSTVATTRPAVPVSGDGTYGTPAPQFPASTPGDYHWVATYSGSSPNTNDVTHNGDCSDTDEDVTVSSIETTLSTTQSWVPNDTVTITAVGGAGGSLAGTAHFTLYDNADCTGTVLYSADVPVSGASPRTVGTANTTAQSTTGSYSWSVSYDSTNAAQEDIAASCQETSALTVDNGGSVSSRDSS
jgi:hypothetical protein